MNSNQRSQGNNQSDNGGNEKSVSSSRGGKDKLNQSQQSGKQQGGSQQGGQIDQQSTDRSGSQTGNVQHGGLPRSPGAGRLAADEDMDEDTGLSNRANRQSADIDQGSKQSEQSNVGRRDDGTPD